MTLLTNRFSCAHIKFSKLQTVFYNVFCLFVSFEAHYPGINSTAAGFKNIVHADMSTVKLFVDLMLNLYCVVSKIEKYVQFKVLRPTGLLFFPKAKLAQILDILWLSILALQIVMSKNTVILVLHIQCRKFEWRG